MEMRKEDTPQDPMARRTKNPVLAAVAQTTTVQACWRRMA